MNVKGKKITILGAKRSGLAVAKFLKSAGAIPFVSDKGETLEQDVKKELDEKGIAYEIGGHTEKIYDSDFVVISPGVPSNAPAVIELEKKGRKVISEIELSAAFCKANIIAITGSEGKTTTTTLTQKIFSADGGGKNYKAYALGNIGEAFAGHLDILRPEDVAVVETSSFQLDHCFNYKPKVAVITNINRNHLDRYNSFEDYQLSKYRIFQNQAENDILIYNRDNEVLREKFTEAFTKSLLPKVIPIVLNEGFLPTNAAQPVGAFVDKKGMLAMRLTEGGEVESIIEKREMDANKYFQGTHNIYNALTAAVAARMLGVEMEIIRQEIMSFRGVEHRLEFVETINGISYVNDSKATTVNSMWSALDTISGTVVLIAGGRDKGNDYTKVASLVKQKVAKVIAIGESRDKVVSAFKDITSVEEASTMEDAVHLASKAAPPNATVLLSPACASFDMFKGGYEERGRVFKELVRNLK